MADGGRTRSSKLIVDDCNVESIATEAADVDCMDGSAAMRRLCLTCLLLKPLVRTGKRARILLMTLASFLRLNVTMMLLLRASLAAREQSVEILSWRYGCRLKRLSPRMVISLYSPLSPSEVVKGRLLLAWYCCQKRLSQAGWELYQVKVGTAPAPSW